jgi:calcineurin-like phosphoesterase
MNANGYTTSHLNILKVGTVDQPILQKSGDDLRIDWGYAYVAANKDQSKQTIATLENAAEAFVVNANGINQQKNRINQNAGVQGIHLGLNTIFNIDQLDQINNSTSLITIPFNFIFNNITYTSFSISTNGLFTFNYNSNEELMSACSMV